jgi:PAS domain S-box-containing protein
MISSSPAALDFELLFNSLPGAYLVLDAKLGVIAVSDELLRATMTKREEILGHYVFDVLPDDPSNPTGFQIWQASLETVLSTRATDVMPVVKYSVKRSEAEGSGFVEKYWRPSNSPVLGKDGEVAYIIHRTEEVTELRKSLEENQGAQARTREAESRMRFALDAGGMGDWELNLVTGKAFRSLKHDQCFGYNELQPEWTLEDALRHIHPDDLGKVRQAHADTSAGKGDMDFESRVIWPDGSLHWISARARTEYDASGKAIRMAGLVWDITEDKTGSERLESEKQKLEAIFVDSPAAMALLRGPTFIFEKINPNYHALMGGRDLLGKSLHEALPELVGQPFHGLMKTVFESGEPFIGRAMVAKLIRRPGGEPEDTYFDYSYSRVNDGLGRPYGIYIHAVNVTEKVMAFQLAAASAERLKAALDAANTGTFRWNIRTGALEWDENLDRLFGLPLNQTIRNLEVFIGAVHPDDRAGVIEQCEKCATLGSDFDMEFRVIWPDGSLHWLDDKGKTFRGKDGGPEYMTGACVDITARKNSEEALKRSEENLRTLTVTIPQLVWTCLPNGECDYLSPQWVDYTGISLDEQLGLDWLEPVIHPDDRDRTLEHWMGAVAGLNPYDIEFRIRRKDGVYRWFKTRGTAVRATGSDQIVNWFGTCTDIQDQKEVESVLNDAVEARDEFLSIASHELKTPLTSLKLQAQMLQRQIQKDDSSVFSKPRVIKLVDQTDKQVNRLVRLVDDMLDIAKIRSGKLILSKERFDLRELVTDAIGRMHSQFLAAECGDPKLTAFEPAIGDWDRMRLEQVLNNLFTNAIRYGKGKPVQVEVECLPAHARLRVRDQGIGIEKTTQAKIFDRFERAVDPNEVSGLGLGLFIVRQIVEAHGGNVWVESDGVGQGSTFFVDLPIAKMR